MTPALGSMANIVIEPNVRLTMSLHQMSQLLSGKQKLAKDEKMFFKVHLT